MDIRTLIVKFVALGEKVALMHSHIIQPARIASLFASYSGARTSVEREGYNSRIIIEKT